MKQSLSDGLIEIGVILVACAAAAALVWGVDAPWTDACVRVGTVVNLGGCR